MDKATPRGFILLCLSFLLLTPLTWADEDTDKMRKQILELNKATGTAAMDGHLKKLAADKPATKKLVSEAAKMSKENPQPLNYNAALVLGIASQIVDDFESAKLLYQSAIKSAQSLKSDSKQILVYEKLIDLFYTNKKFEDAIKVCMEFLEIRTDDPKSELERIKPLIMEKLIQAKVRNGQVDEALKMTNELIEANEESWYFYQLKGWIYRESDRNEEAIETYQKVIERLGKSKRIPEERREKMIDGVRYLLSGLYVDMKEIDKSAEQLKILLKRNPDNPTFNNDLGYIWADNDKNLEESEKMIRKAIELDRQMRKKIEDLTPEEDKDSAAYLDSLGWVLYKKKEYAEAKKQLLLAIEQDEGKHIEIYDHLADVHMALGEKKEAIEIWKKGLEFKEVSKRDKERRKKVEEKLKKAEENK